MTVKNQRHFFLRCVLTLALLSATASVQAIAQLTGTFSVQSIVLLAGMTAAQTTDENGDIDMEALGLSLAELFDLEVTIATGVKQSVARAPSVTSVITAQDIEATGATTLDEALEMVPGLHTEYFSFTYRPVYTVRGMYSGQNQQVLMLLNGVPITSLIYGNSGLIWAGMSVSGIDRIEVIRGPGSAVYGAEAFAGVVNIITKTAAGIEGTETGMRVGNFDTEDAWVVHGGNYGGFDVAVSMEYQSTDGHEGIVDIDAQTHLDKNFNTQASLAPGKVNVQKRSLDSHLNISKGNWHLNGSYQGQSDLGAGVGPADALDALGRYRNEKYNAGLIYHNPELTNNWDVTAQVNYYHTRHETDTQTVFPPGAFGGKYPQGYVIDTSASESHTYLNLSGFYTGFKKHLLRLGVGYHYSDLYQLKHYTNTDPITRAMIPSENGLMDVSDTPYAWIPETDRDNWYIFLQDMWTIADNLELTAGIRYDEYSDFGSTINPRFALVWQPRSDLTTKLLYGSAFRAPGFAELHSSNNPAFFGNPNLDPETIDTWELAFDYRATNTLHFSTNLFTYKWTDGIMYGPGETEGAFKIANMGVQKGHGLELETRWKMTKKSSLLANYAFVKATDDLNNQDAGNYPQHSAYLRTDWLVYPNWYLDTQFSWIGERKRPFGDSRSPVDDYTTVNLTLRRKDINQDHWNFAVSVRNLFDTDARSPSPGSNVPNDLPLAGRYYWVEMRYRF